MNNADLIICFIIALLLFFLPLNQKISKKNPSYMIIIHKHYIPEEQ